MKVIILAAGYATRLYPLTLTQPKPLLPVAGKPMIEYVLDNLAPIGGIERIYVVTNAKFAGQFQQWADGYRGAQGQADFTIVNDGSTDDSNKLGAIGDIHFVLTHENVDDDIIVVAGDNLFSEKLDGLRPVLPRKRTRRCWRSTTWAIWRKSKIQRHHAGRRRPHHVLRGKTEKPRPARSPASRFTTTPSTSCRSSSNTSPRATTRTSRAGSCNGSTRACRSTPGRCPGIWYDIGSKETLEEANRIFGQKRG